MITTNTSAQLTNVQNNLAVERGKRKEAEDKLLQIKAELSMYSAIDRDFAGNLIESIDETMEVIK